MAWTEFEYNIFVHETRSTTVECGDRDQLIQIGLGNMHALTGMQIETEKLDHESLPGFDSGQRGDSGARFESLHVVISSKKKTFRLLGRYVS